MSGCPSIHCISELACQIAHKLLLRVAPCQTADEMKAKTLIIYTYTYTYTYNYTYTYT